MKNILVTGSSGFLASQFIKIIDNKYRIFGLDLKKDLKNKHINHNFKKINLTLNKNLKFLNKINFHYVLHAAAQQPSSSEINEYSFFRNNVNSTLNLIKNLKKDKLKKIVYCSSFSVYDLKDKSKNIKETDTLKPINFYGLTKKISEDILIYFSNVYKFDLVILRFDGIYGADQNMPGFIKNCTKDLIRNKNFELYNLGINKRDHVYVKDAARAILNSFLLKGKKTIEIFNIGGGEPISQKNIAKILKKKLNSKSQLLMKKNKNRVFKSDVYMNLDKAKKNLRYKPKKISINLNDFIKKINEKN